MPLEKFPRRRPAPRESAATRQAFSRPHATANPTRRSSETPLHRQPQDDPSGRQRFNDSDLRSPIATFLEDDRRFGETASNPAAVVKNFLLKGVSSRHNAAELEFPHFGKS